MEWVLVTLELVASCLKERKSCVWSRKGEGAAQGLSNLPEAEERCWTCRGGASREQEGWLTCRSGAARRAPWQLYQTRKRQEPQLWLLKKKRQLVAT